MPHAPKKKNNEHSTNVSLSISTISLKDNKSHLFPPVHYFANWNKVPKFRMSFRVQRGVIIGFKSFWSTTWGSWFRVWNRVLWGIQQTLGESLCSFPQLSISFWGQRNIIGKLGFILSCIFYTHCQGSKNRGLHSKELLEALDKTVECKIFDNAHSTSSITIFCHE